MVWYIYIYYTILFCNTYYIHDSAVLDFFVPCLDFVVSADFNLCRFDLWRWRRIDLNGNGCKCSKCMRRWTEKVYIYNMSMPRHLRLAFLSRVRNHDFWFELSISLKNSPTNESGMMRWYCWWKKSCTSWYGESTTILRWYRISYINSIMGTHGIAEAYEM